MRATTPRAFCSQNFGEHAATTEGTANTARHFFQARIAGTSFLNQLRHWILTRIGRVQAFLVGHDHQRIGFDQVGDQGRQGIVIAKFNFIRHYRVILINDRDNIQSQQRAQRGARIQITLTIGKIFMRE